MKVTLDTNVLARVVVDDPEAPAQCAAARKAIASAKAVIIPQVVQIELCWLLESAFGLRHTEIVKVLGVLKSNPRIELEHKAIFDATLENFAGNAAWGFADCLIATVAVRHDSKLLTFDKKLARLIGSTVLR